MSKMNEILLTKQLLPNLGDLYKKEDLISAFEKCGLDPKSRAEDVSLETWIKFCNTILR